MNKEIRATVENLQGLIGCEIIRTKKTKSGDASFTNQTVKLEGFSSLTGKMVVRNNSTGKKETLGLDFTDDGWVTELEARMGGDSPLNEWIGKPVKRKCATCHGSRFYMCQSKGDKPPVLVHASEHHIVVRDGDDEVLLGPEFANPNDWELAE